MIIAVWNLITFAMMGVDKRKSIKNGWRISEKTIFLCAFLFGGLGVFLGMQLFRHKTKHLSFKVLVPVAVMLNIAACVFLYIGSGP